MKNVLIKASLVVLVLGLMLPNFAMAADTGADLFATKCASCHGKDGAGATPMGKNLKLKDLGSAEVQKQSDAELKTIIEKGKGKMPAYGTKLSSTQVDEAVKHIRSLKK